MTTLLVVVRQVQPTVESTAALLHRLQRKILPMDEPAPTEKGWWWLAVKDGHPVGFANLCKSSQWGDAGYLARSGVLGSARGKGLQKRMIRVRESKARALGLRWLVTDTNCNPASANSLITCGFKMFDPTNPWADKMACYWKKELK